MLHNWIDDKEDEQADSQGRGIQMLSHNENEVKVLRSNSYQK